MSVLNAPHPLTQPPRRPPLPSGAARTRSRCQLVLRPWVHVVHGRRARCPESGQRGQATAEYALVLLGAAAIALMLTAWASKSGAIGRLFDTVVDQLIDDAG